jgi:hypothetical protein
MEATFAIALNRGTALGTERMAVSSSPQKLKKTRLGWPRRTRRIATGRALAPGVPAQEGVVWVEATLAMAMATTEALAEDVVVEAIIMVTAMVVTTVKTLIHIGNI